MDLRNLASTPNQPDGLQRRPSLLSLSSSGLSSYGGNNNSNGNNTPQLSNQRLTKTLNLSNPWNLGGQGNVGPWVEQQQQQQENVGGVNTILPEKEVNHEVDDSIDQEDVNDMGELDDDDDLIPTAIVIKNIPFAIKKEQLLDAMTKLNLPLPYAFNYHFDNGVFRGLAFANFTSTDETSAVVNNLNGREIGGRKLRVEYKKMLPAQERERIEREKREKRGQLEEQHRSTSNASLGSLLSQASTTAATKNLSVNGTPQMSNTTERVFMNFPLNSNLLGPLPMDVNFNDAEILELYSHLLLFRDDLSKSIFELALNSTTLSINYRKTLSSLCSFLNLLELFDNGFIIIRRKTGHISQAIAQPPHQVPQLIQQQPSHSSSMMNLTQLNQLGQHQQQQQQQHPQHPELLRSHSQSALPLPRMRNQTSTPIQHHFPQYQSQQQSQQQNFGQPQGTRAMNPQLYNTYQQQQNNSGGSASLLRSTTNRSYVDMRATPPLNPTDSPTAQHSLLQQNASQPGTPLGTNDLNSRFQPFGQHQLQGSFTNLHQSISSSQLNDYGSNNDLLNNKLSSMNLSNNYDSNSGIWGPK